MKSTVLLTGSNRGIGLALARQFLTRGHRVIAACREVAAATELQALGAIGGPALDIQALDTTSEPSVAALATHVKSKYASLDVLINNAGVFPDRDGNSIADLDFEKLAASLQTNLVGTARLTKALWPLLKLGTNSRVINISAGSGLISPKRNSNYYSYSISKAALNMLTRLLEHEGREQSICVVAVTPGRVQTRMGDKDAPLTAEEAAQSLAVMVEGLKLSDAGAILDRNGKPCFDGQFKDAAGRVCHVGW
jgi:NAD(P)-dependent dehydrogenase (short-subunit alcohol dehydrogenase family)